MSGILPNTNRPADLAPGLRVGDWLVAPALGRVSRDRVTVHLRPQLMDLILVFAKQPGRVISKDELFAAVWPGQSVAESALARCVAELRQVFGDDARSPRVIETIPKRGYRLVAPVSELSAVGPVDDESVDSPGADRGSAAAPLAGASNAREDFDTPPSLVATASRRDWPHGGAPAAEPERRTSAASHAGRRVFWPAVAAASLLVGAVTFAATVWLAGPAAPVDRIILADFANRTREAGLDATLRLALAVHLQREPSFEVLADGSGARPSVPSSETDAPDAGRATATEVCMVQQGTAVIHGSITVFGARYALGLEATSCRSGAVLVRELVEARSKDDVLDALETAAASLRRKLVVMLAEDRRGRTTRLALHTDVSDAIDAARDR